MPINHNSSDARVSVIIPTHNRLNVLPRAITSVLEQSHDVYEIIVIDDGSTDATSDWLAQQPEPIHVITQTNHGVSHARNRGIEMASGQWIALLDSDDYWHKDKLTRQLHGLQLEPESRFCHCDEIWIRNGKRVNPKSKHRKYGGYVFEQCLPLCAISPSAAVIHKELFESYGLFDETLPACEDYDLWLRISAHENISFVDELLLTKTGGHEDQLSARYPIMDRYRLQALAKVIRSKSLRPEQAQMALKTFHEKLSVVRGGAVKRNNEPLIQELSENYSDLLNARSQLQ